MEMDSPVTPSPPPASPYLNLDLLYHLLRVEKTAGFTALARAAFADSVQLGTLTLSFGERDNIWLGQGSREVLDRKRQRIADYTEVYRHVSNTGVTQLRGLELARLYPEGSARVSNDLDLASEAERDVWKAAKAVLAARDVKQVSFVIFGYPQRHLYVGLRWDPVDPVFDDMGHVELCTAAYSERWSVLPPLADIPAPVAIKNFLSIAEEGFSRDFRIRDAIDVVALLPQVGPVSDIAEKATSWLNAPELLRLVEYVIESCRGSAVDTSELEKLASELTLAVSDEIQRRKGVTLWGGEESDRTVERLQTGHRVHGTQLNSIGSSAQDDTLSIEETPSGVIGRTPIGDFLLAKKGTVDSSMISSARDYLQGRTA